MRISKVDLIVIAVVLRIAAGLFNANSCRADEPKAGTAAATASPNRVEIKDFMFHPAALQVVAGAKVTFVNRDEEPHTVVSRDGKFTKSRPLDTDQEFTVALPAPGEYFYFCSVHPQMMGKITVVAP